MLAKKNCKLLFIVFFTLAVLGIFFYGAIKKQQTPSSVAMTGSSPIEGILVKEPTTIGEFALTANTGKPFTKNDLEGKWTLLFFGFTNCADVCPTTLSALNKMYIQLQKELPENQLPQVVFVSVDPERDTLERMNEYVNSFNPHFSGARADLPATEALEKQLHIIAVKMQAKGQPADHYSVNHTAEILVVNPQAQVQAYLSYPHSPEQLVKDYRVILGKS